MKRAALFAVMLLTACSVWSQDQVDAKVMTKAGREATAPCRASYAGPSGAAFSKIETGNGAWIKDTRSDTVVVFLHGIWSDAVSAWLTTSEAPSDPCFYWPDLLVGDTTYFKDVDVFVAGYYSSADSGTYTIADAAMQVFTALSVPLDGHDLAPLHRKNILFLAHSLGGIVIRQTLQANSAAFDGHKIGLALMGSPTKGSDYAKGISDWLGSYYSNALLRDLSTDSPVLGEIDNSFRQWLEVRRASQQTVSIAEFYESTFPAKGCTLLVFCKWVSVQMPPIVEQSAWGRYDPQARRIGNTDHLTLVKPTQRDSGIHAEIRRFFGGSFPQARTVYSGSWGQIEVTGTSKTHSWQQVGMTSDWVFPAQWPCVSTGTDNSCGPWIKTLGSGFNASDPKENDHGFVVAKDGSIGRVEPDFVFSDAFAPPSGAATFDGKAVYSSLSRTARYKGKAPQSATIRTMVVQPVVYQATSKDARLSKIPIPTGIGDVIEIEIPATLSEPRIVITSIAGTWSVPPKSLVAGTKYGVLQVASVDASAGTQKVSFRVWPR